MTDGVRFFHGWRSPATGQPFVLVDGERFQLPALLPGEVRHSPDGFNWGYHGSGPAELARAILIAVFPTDPMVRRPSCYQQFKAEIIGGLPAEWTLTADAVRAWYVRWHGSLLVKGVLPTGECG